MKYAELKELTTEELRARLQEDKASLTKFKFGHAVSSLENPLKINALRKDIARLNTELTQRKLAAATSNNQ
jgi:large subunit ribosomal protein L29